MYVLGAKIETRDTVRLGSRVACYSLLKPLFASW
jgi:hypothetical protein